VALSTVSVEGAKLNLKTEMSKWNFDDLAAAALKEWEGALGQVKAKSSDPKLLETFYTALYHTHLAPTVLSDVDGQFCGPDGKVHQAKGYDYYTELSLWDTFRAENPLLTLFQPQRVNDMVKTMLAHFSLYGRGMLPIWPEGAGRPGA